MPGGDQPSPPSAIWAPGSNGFAPDIPVVQDADYEFDDFDRSYLDSQNLGAQNHLVQSLINGRHCTWVRLDAGSAAVATGLCVCLAGTTAGTVTLATSSALTAAGSAFGVVILPAAPGAWILVARGGLLPPSITGLPTSGANLYAKVNTSTGAITTASSLLSTDYPLGTVDAAGNLNLCIQFTPIASSAPPWLTTQTVSGGGTVTAGSTKMVFVDATGGTCTVNAPSIAANMFWGVCDGKKGGSFSVSHGASIPNSSHIIEDPNNPGVYTTDPIVMNIASQRAIWMADPSATFFKLVG